MFQFYGNKRRENKTEEIKVNLRRHKREGLE